uniref:CAZy families GH29 protein n=2 Tax=uncultured Lactobacillus sp. TaxID=153152 RepID=A0A060C007_9LACO|nr:CAZy families GH29 protein [uncultured Lactobacillus sp.]
MIREKNPNCIIINNTGLENKGKLIHPEIDSVTYEQGKIDNDFISDKEIAFEVCYPINDH